MRARLNRIKKYKDIYNSKCCVGDICVHGDCMYMCEYIHVGVRYMRMNVIYVCMPVCALCKISRPTETGDLFKIEA